MDCSGTSHDGAGFITSLVLHLVPRFSGLQRGGVLALQPAASTLLGSPGGRAPADKAAEGGPPGALAFLDAGEAVLDSPRAPTLERGPSSNVLPAPPGIRTNGAAPSIHPPHSPCRPMMARLCQPGIMSLMCASHPVKHHIIHWQVAPAQNRLGAKLFMLTVS